MTTDRNSEGAVGTLRVTPYGDFLGVNWNRPQTIYNGQAIYTTPPASIPAAEVQALVERWRADAAATSGCRQEHDASSAYDDALESCADELAKLARDYAPEVSQKPPSPRGK